MDNDSPYRLLEGAVGIAGYLYKSDNPTDKQIRRARHLVNRGVIPVGRFDGIITSQPAAIDEATAKMMADGPKKPSQR